MMTTVNCYVILVFLLLTGKIEDLIVIEEVGVIKPLDSPDSLPVILLDVKPLKKSWVTAGPTRPAD